MTQAYSEISTGNAMMGWGAALAPVGGAGFFFIAGGAALTAHGISMLSVASAHAIITAQYLNNSSMQSGGDGNEENIGSNSEPVDDGKGAKITIGEQKSINQ